MRLTNMAGGIRVSSSSRGKRRYRLTNWSWIVSKCTNSLARTPIGSEFSRVCEDVRSASGNAGANFFENDLFHLLGETLGDLQVPQGMTGLRHVVRGGWDL